MRISFFAMMITCFLLIACEKNKNADQTTSKIVAETIAVKAEPTVDEIIVEQKSSEGSSDDKNN